MRVLHTRRLSGALAPLTSTQGLTGRSCRVLLGLVILVGVAVRLLLLLQWPRRLNPDEATVGLMGLHILRGVFPVFFTGQGYLGGLESYLAALAFVVAGVSPLTLKVGVFLFSSLLIGIIFLTGKRMAGWPGGLTCALLAAVAPPFLPVFGNYSIGGYPGVVVIGSLILLLTLDLVTSEGGGAPRERTLLVLGLLAGLGWWTHPMILSYVVTAGIFLLLRARLWSFRALWAVPLAFLLGSLPFWVFNLNHSFWSFAIFERSGWGGFTLKAQKTFSRLQEIAGVRDMLTDPVPWLSPAAAVVYLFLVGVLLVDLGRRIPRPAPEARVLRRGVQLLLLFSLIHLVAFSLHRFATLGGTTRYLFPLYSSLPVLTGIAILRVWGWSRLLAVGALVVLLVNNGLALGKAVQFFEAAKRRDWWTPDPVVDLLRSEGVTRAYAGREIAPRLTFETRERLVVTDPFKERYLPYLQWVDASPRVAYVLTRRAWLSATRFQSGLQGIGASYRRKDFGQFSVFYDFHPSSDGALASMPPAGWRAEANPPGTDPARAFDRDVDSAWVSDRSLEPAMGYRVDLGAMVPVGGITILPVRTGAAIPKGYRIELSRDGTTWEAVASVPEFRVTLRWRHGQPRMDRSGHIVSRFRSRPVRYVRITQTGADPDERWAIAELFVYRLAGAPVQDRQEASAHVREGMRLEADRRWGPALAAYARAVRLDPESEETHWRMAQVYEKAGLPPDGADPYQRGLIFEPLGMQDRAIRQYELLLEQAHRDGQHSDFLRRLLDLYRRRGEQEKAAHVERRLREDYAPPIRVEARFGQSARLLGYAAEPREPRAGEVVELSYYWQALEPTREDLSVFVHFVQNGRIRFGQDHEPLHGRYPTSQWKPGELVRESYRVRLPEDLPPGEYDLQVGLWNAETRKRLRVEETSRRHGRHEAHLGAIRVLPPR